jgi:cell shape-determining protein MreC
MLITEKIFDFSTGEETIIEREETAEEIAYRELKLAEAQAKLAEAEAKATQKAALLERLGITEAEAKLLLG